MAEKTTGHSGGIPLSSSTQRDIDRLSTLLQVRDDQLTRLEQGYRTQVDRVRTLEAELLRTTEDKDAALKTLLLIVRGLDTVSVAGEPATESARPWTVSPLVAHAEVALVESSHKRYEAVVGSHGKKDSIGGDELNANQEPRSDRGFDDVQDKQNQTGGEEIVYFAFPFSGKKTTTPAVTQQEADIVLEKDGGHIDVLASKKKQVSRWSLDLEEQLRIMQEDRSRDRGFSRHLPPRYPGRGQQQDRPYHDYDAVHSKASWQPLQSYDENTRPKGVLQSRRQLISYDDAEYPEPPPFLPSRLQGRQNSPLRGPTADQRQEKKFLSYKPAGDEGTGFRTVIIDGIIPGTHFKDLPLSLIGELDDHIPRGQVISQQLLNTTHITKTMGSTMMLMFNKEADASNFVTIIKNKPLSLGGQACRVTLLHSPTWPTDSLTKSRIENKGACRTLVIHKKPAKLTAPELISLLLDGLKGIYDENGIFQLRAGVLQGLRIREDAAVEVSFDSVAKAWYAWCMCWATYLLRQCHVEFWKSEDAMVVKSALVARSDAELSLEEGEIRSTRNDRADKSLEGSEAILKSEADGAKGASPKGYEKTLVSAVSMPQGGCHGADKSGEPLNSIYNNEQLENPAFGHDADSSIKDTAVHTADMNQSTGPRSNDAAKSNKLADDHVTTAALEDEIYLSHTDIDAEALNEATTSPNSCDVTNPNTLVNGHITPAALEDEICLSDMNTTRKAPVEEPTPLAPPSPASSPYGVDVTNPRKQETEEGELEEVACLLDTDTTAEVPRKEPTPSTSVPPTLPPYGRNEISSKGQEAEKAETKKGICLSDIDASTGFLAKEPGSLTSPPLALPLQKNNRICRNKKDTEKYVFGKKICLSDTDTPGEAPRKEPVPSTSMPLTSPSHKTNGTSAINHTAEERVATLDLHDVLDAAKPSSGGDLLDSKWAHAYTPRPVPKRNEGRPFWGGRRGSDRDHAAEKKGGELNY